MTKPVKRSAWTPLLPAQALGNAAERSPLSTLQMSSPSSPGFGDGTQSENVAERYEPAILLVMLLLFVTVNLVTGSRCPIALGDEIGWTDPAANLYFGKGLTSSVWFVQPPDAFWAGNVPFHPVLLFLWMRIFGFSSLAVRSMAYAMMSAAAFLLWLTVRRKGWIASPQWRLAMVAVVLSGYGVAYGYRSGRPDATTILLACAAAFAGTLERRSTRRAALASLGFLFAWTGPQLAFYAVVMCCLIAAFERRTFWRDGAFLLLGEGLGAAGLFLLYSAHGVWGDFLASVIGFHTPLGKMSFSRKLHDIRTQLGGLKDPSVLLLLALSCWRALLGNRSGRSRAFLRFGLCSSACIPLAMFLVAFYAIYYSWMVYIPLTLCLCASLESDWHVALTRRARWGALATLALASVLGLPVYCGLAAAHWTERDPALVERLAQKALHSDDWVLCQYSAYYGVKRHAQLVFVEYMSPLTDEEKRRVSALVIRPEEFQDAAQTVGGHWRDTGEGVRSKYGSGLMGLARSKIFEMYNLEVYRRVDY